MEISDDLLCLFTDEVQAENDSFRIEVPKQEVKLGAIDPDETYRVALLPTEIDTQTTDTAEQDSAGSERPDPPVDVGDTQEVEIESLGDKGDGIARVDRGYVLIVPDTEVGDRVTVRIEEAKENVAFTEVVERDHRLQND